MTLLAIDDLVIKRGGRRIIDELSLSVDDGELVAVVGKNGCGKTTLLSSIAGVLEPHSGRIAIAGASVWGTSRERQRARRALGYVPEAADPPGFLTGRELWALCASTRDAVPPSQAVRDALGLDELAEVQLERMSLGQRRRACLGAAMLGPPDLLVLDEPDNGLDAKRLDALVGLLRDHAQQGRGAILASHDAAWLDQLAARVIAM